MNGTLPTRRDVLATAAAAGAVGTFYGDPAAAAGENAIGPFQVSVSEEELVDLRRCITATKWPEREQVTDDSQGVQLDTIQKLARYWATEYDWRKMEARL